MRWLIAVLFLFGVAVTGCAAKSLEPGAQDVRLTNDQPGAECVYRGEVTGHQGGWLKGSFTTNARLEQGARNDLKNAATAIDANVVQVITAESGISAVGIDGGSETTLMTYVGAAYACP